MVKTLYSARASLYFWWIAYLRKSIDYWWICKCQGKCEDPRIIKVWEDFGDVFSYKTFDEWWLNHASSVFGQNINPQHFDSQTPVHCICELDKEDFLKQNLPEKGLFFYIPAHLNQDLAKKSLLQALKLIEQTKIRSHADQLELVSRYGLCPLDLKTKKLLIPIYRVLSLDQCIELASPSSQLKNWKAYEIGRHLNIAPQNKPKPGDNIDNAKKKQSRIRCLVSQNKKAASLIIQNVEIGKFPCKAPVPEMTRWSPKQLQERDEAIAAGLWQDENWLSEEYRYMDPCQGRLLEVDHQSPHQEILSILNAFGSMPTPFLSPKRKRKGDTNQFK